MFRSHRQDLKVFWITYVWCIQLFDCHLVYIVFPIWWQPPYQPGWKWSCCYFLLPPASWKPQEILTLFFCFSWFYLLKTGVPLDVSTFQFQGLRSRRGKLLTFCLTYHPTFDYFCLCAFQQALNLQLLQSSGSAVSELVFLSLEWLSAVCKLSLRWDLWDSVFTRDVKCWQTTGAGSCQGEVAKLI